MVGVYAVELSAALEKMASVPRTLRDYDDYITYSRMWDETNSRKRMESSKIMSVSPVKNKLLFIQVHLLELEIRCYNLRDVTTKRIATMILLI